MRRAGAPGIHGAFGIPEEPPGPPEGWVASGKGGFVPADEDEVDADERRRQGFYPDNEEEDEEVSENGTCCCQRHWRQRH